METERGLPETMLYEALTAYHRPPQVNGAEHYDVEIKTNFIDAAAGRLTRREPPSRHPTPGWYVWIEVHHLILRNPAHNVIYFPTPEDALQALWDALCTSPSDLPT